MQQQNIGMHILHSTCMYAAPHGRTKAIFNLLRKLQTTVDIVDIVNNFKDCVIVNQYIGTSTGVRWRHRYEYSG
jgi:hypothetical protein